ncbi:MAG: citrate lyase subunit alpha, partial [Pseudomonadota bacterium]
MQVRSDRPRRAARGPARSPKALPDVNAAFDACAVSDGAVLSFHHHLRNGDAVLTHVLRVAQARGLRGLGIAASSIFPVQGELAQHMRAGTVDRVWTSYMKGDAADAIAAGALPQPAIFQSHGGRARALANGEIPIDVAFIAAPVCDEDGALTGAVCRAACGPLGYPQEDARAASHVVALVEEIRAGPLPRQEIDGERVHHVVQVPSIG